MSHDQTNEEFSQYWELRLERTYKWVSMSPNVIYPTVKSHNLGSNPRRIFLMSVINFRSYQYSLPFRHFRKMNAGMIDSKSENDIGELN